MIRLMENIDLAQCGMIYAKAFPMEHWGIGKQLLNAVKNYSKEKGLAGIVLYTSEYAPAAKFYEKNVFKLSNGTICMYCE